MLLEVRLFIEFDSWVDEIQKEELSWNITERDKWKLRGTAASSLR
jgi:hypothetical protein